MLEPLLSLTADSFTSSLFNKDLASETNFSISFSDKQATIDGCIGYYAVSPLVMDC
jgi:hypothetical protein